MDFTFTVLLGEKLERDVEHIGDVLAKYEGKRVVVSIKEAPKPQKPNKRRYYFACIVSAVHQALREAGNIMDEQETHILLKRDVGKLRKTVWLPNGEQTVTLRSYRDLTPKEEGDYITACTVWATELGIDIPPPNTDLHNTVKGE